MKTKNKLSMILAIAALCFAAVVGFTLAYFTDTKRAEGVLQLNLQASTTIHEEADDVHKDIVIANTGEADVKVRVLLFYEDRYVASINPGEGWSESDGVWYYEPILEKGAETTILTVKLDSNKTQNQNFDIVVAQEAILAHETWPDGPAA